MYISISSRLLVNLESLNSVESIGALVRHRTAPITVVEDGLYRIRFVPVVSGESIAHGYQALLVEEASKMGLPLGIYSAREEFIKFAENRFMEEEGIEPPKNEDDILRAEIDVLTKDIVADIGGFLYAGDYPIKRTSRFSVGYMIPAIGDVNAAALEAQFHVRMVPSRATEKGARGRAPPQAPFNVEVGSALYTYTFTLDIDGIAEPATRFGFDKLTQEAKKKLDDLRNSKVERVKAALKALVKLYSNSEFGAKRSRFLPNLEYRSIVVTLSHPCRFVASPGNDKGYILDTAKRMEAFKKALDKLDEKIESYILVYDKEGGFKDHPNIERFDVPEELFDKLIALILEKLEKEKKHG